MSFNPNARLDPSQVQDTRGRGGGIGAGGVAIGGGGLGLVALLVALLLGVNPLETGSVPTGYDELAGQEVGQQGSGSQSLAERCRTGADANQYEDCRIVGYVNSIQTYWSDEFAARGGRYEQAQTRFFSGAT